MNFIKEPCDIILLAGQSNAVGCGRGDVTEAIEDNPDVLLFYDTQVEGYEKDENGKDVLTVKEPFVYDIKIMSEKNAEGNIAFSFANEYVKEGRLQAGRKLLIVRAAVGGTGFFKREWTKDGILFKRMLEMLEKTLAMNPENRLVALCWHQGESDAFERQDLIDTERKERYERYFSELIVAVRELCGNAKLPVMAAGFTDEWSVHYKEQCNAVISATKSVFEKLGNGRFHSAVGLLSNNQKIGNGDDIHFCKESLHILGQKYYNSFKEIIGE